MAAKVDVAQLVAQMSLGEQIELCSGRDFWHTKPLVHATIPAMMLTDGPSGVRCQEGAADMLGLGAAVPSTCFPAAATTACTWDDALLERIGAAIGREALSLGVGMILGPGANIKRNPLCGRSFEYFSEDPLLSGHLAAAWIRGIERTGAQACLKHFACNNQELRRHISNSIIDERALREIYLASFEYAVKKGKPSAVMSAYNRINGEYCSSNRWLLTDVLRREWGFDGMVVTDWGGIEDRVAAFRAGCDLCMPGGSAFGEPEAYEAVKVGVLPQKCVTRSATRIARSIVRAHDALKKTSRSTKPANRQTTSNTMQERSHVIAFEAAVKGAVLLKNKNALLPLTSNSLEHAVLIGAMAASPRYQGAGSSRINPRHVVSPHEAMPQVPYVAGYKSDGSISDEALNQAVEAARKAEVAIICAGLPDAYESEGFDRTSLAMPEGHVRLIEAVAAVNPRTVVVLMCGSVVEMPWEDSVASVLWMGLGGEAVGEAASVLLTGERCPSGRLAESWPYRLKDCVSSSFYANTHTDAHYREGLYVGYRYYTSAGIPVRYPFGFGLSYTQFSYSDLYIEDSKRSIARVACTVRNNGVRSGTEVVQLYLTAPEPRGYRPERTLCAYKRVELCPNEEKRIVLEIEPRAVSVWRNGWHVVPGTYRVLVGQNSRDIALEGDLTVEGVATRVPYDAPAWYLTCKGVPTEQDFSDLMGQRIIEKTTHKGSYTMTNSIEQMSKDSRLMRLVYRIIEWIVALRCGGIPDYSNPEFKMQMASSVGATLASLRVAGCVRSYIFEGLLEIVNGHLLRGLRLITKHPRRLS